MDEKQGMGKKVKTATFAGGCFWCMQPPFRMLEGVIHAVSGYAGGKTENPTYEEVSRGTTGHLESVQVTYDEDKISYDTLLDTFWRQIDPTDPAGQFADKGSQVQDRHILPRRRTKRACRSIEEEDRCIRKVCKTRCNRDPAVHEFLPG